MLTPTPDDLEVERVRAVSRAIHEHLCRRDIMQYLDNDEDCEGLARAALAAATPRVDQSTILATIVAAYERHAGCQMVEPAGWIVEAAGEVSKLGMGAVKWLPIKSAPKDGRWFVAASFYPDEEPEYEVGRYDPMPWVSYVEAGDGLYRRVEETITEWRGFNNFHRATHWCALLDAPVRGGGE